MDEQDRSDRLRFARKLHQEAAGLPSHDLYQSWAQGSAVTAAQKKEQKDG